MPNWKIELAKLEQAIGPPVAVGGRVLSEDSLSYVCRGIRGDGDVLAALRLSPTQSGLGSRDKLLEVIRATRLDPLPQSTRPASAPPQPAPSLPEDEPAPPPAPPPVQAAATPPTPSEQQDTPPDAPLPLVFLGDDPAERATSVCATVVFQPERPTKQHILTAVDLARPDVIWVKARAKVGFHKGNEYWVADPLLPQPQAAPIWVQEDRTWDLAIRGRLLEEYEQGRNSTRD